MMESATVHPALWGDHPRGAGGRNHDGPIGGRRCFPSPRRSLDVRGGGRPLRWTVRPAVSPARFTPWTAIRPTTGDFQIALLAGRPPYWNPRAERVGCTRC